MKKRMFCLLLTAFCCAVPVIATEKKELPERYEHFKDKTPREMWLLGSMYYNGGPAGMAVDHHQAFLWWTLAAEKGEPDAMCDLAGCYIRGTGTKINIAEGLKWLKKAVEHNNPRACYNLGLHHMNGDIVQRDPAEAVRLWKIAADQEHPTALFNLGWCYAEGVGGVKADPAEAFKLWLKAAEKGHDLAQLNCARCYRDGGETKQDLQEAIKWYRKAVEQGNQNAMFELAECLLRVNKTDEANCKEAIMLLAQLVELGRTDAQVLLGMTLMTPDCPYFNPPEAIKLFELAAKKEYPVALFLLGVIYYQGVTVEKDQKKGLDLIQKAADAGLPDAKAYLEQIKAGQR